ncbi:MAG TPA: zinc-binding dehydrogenase [Actinomycetes bacterium]|nr:zinc-binding dehydrogenase [Actinomycetes bacterium]
MRLGPPRLLKPGGLRPRLQPPPSGHRLDAATDPRARVRRHRRRRRRRRGRLRCRRPGRQSGVEPDQTALIAGAGPIGIGLWFALRARGVDRVLVSEPSSSRRETIQGLGATDVLDPTGTDLAPRVAELTDGHGADVAFDAAGVGVATLTAIASLTPGGRLVVVALHEKGLDFNPTVLVMGETSVVGTLAYLPEDFDAVIAAMAEGRYSTDGWVAEIAPDQLVHTFGELRQGQGTKVLVRV